MDRARFLTAALAPGKEALGYDHCVERLAHPGWCENLVKASSLVPGERVLVVVDEPLVAEGAALAAALKDAGGEPRLELWAGERPLRELPAGIARSGSHCGPLDLPHAGAARGRGGYALQAPRGRHLARGQADPQRLRRPRAARGRALRARARPRRARTQAVGRDRRRRDGPDSRSGRDRPDAEDRRAPVEDRRNRARARRGGELSRRRDLRRSARGRRRRRARRRPDRPVHGRGAGRRAGRDAIRARPGERRSRAAGRRSCCARSSSEQGRAAT